MGVGFLHGVLPQGISRSYFSTPRKISVLTTDEVLFPMNLRQELEEELHVRFSVTVTRDWESMLANVVASPSADLIFLPSYWANTLAHQNLLANVAGIQGELLRRVSTDFVKSRNPETFTFLPIYWMKTGIDTPLDESFLDYLKNKKETFLFLLADEDLLLKHFQTWKEQGLLEQINSKRILTLQLDQLSKTSDEGAVETPLNRDFRGGTHPFLSALLIWGAAIPANSTQKELALEILEVLTNVEHQEKGLLGTPFNSTFSTVTGKEIPLHRRADFIRDLELKDTLILETKDQEAPLKLKNDFNFIL
ncbi:hypothetical protein [Bdellovibrio bacteriovorus]|uniref:hypothetical protein n=1 Tax=Bdellovibrio bacteriovorus TaxID=959 RepID=UPI003CFBF454